MVIPALHAGEFPLAQEGLEIIVVGVIQGHVYLAAGGIMARGVEEDEAVVASGFGLIMVVEAFENPVGGRDISPAFLGAHIGG